MTDPIDVEVEMTPEQFGKLLNGAENRNGDRYQMSIYFPNGVETIKVSGLGDLKPFQEFSLRIRLTAPIQKERK